MIRIMISILIFIAPVILCENEIERSSHFESPETEGYGWIFSWDILKIIGLIVAGTVHLRKSKAVHFYSKRTF